MSTTQPITPIPAPFDTSAPRHVVIATPAPVLADTHAADAFSMANAVESWLKGQRTAANYARQGATA